MAPKSQVKLSVSRTIAFRCSSDSGNIAALELTVAKDHAQTLRYRIEAPRAVKYFNPKHF
jgi:hypothetical protein